MSQVVPGILVGQNVYWFRGTGLPSAQTSQPYFTCAVGSLYSRLDGSAGSILYVCTVAPTPPTVNAAGVAGTWSPIA
jgi:hypothetical protein